MPSYPILHRSRKGFSLIELLVAMTIVSFLGGAIFVTLAQGIRIWQAAVRESKQGVQEFFFEEIKSELRNSFFYGKSAFNGQNQMLEFHALVSDLRGKGSQTHTLKVPAQIRYRFQPEKKLIQKEITFYEKMLNKRSALYKTKPALEGVATMSVEYYQRPKKATSASWVQKWSGTCFPEAVKITMSLEASPALKETRIFSIPTAGECSEEGNDSV